MLAHRGSGILSTCQERPTGTDRRGLGHMDIVELTPGVRLIPISG